MNKIKIAVDPGAVGGFAIATYPYKVLDVDAVKMPKGIEAQLELMESLAEGCEVEQFFIENVGGYRPGNSGPSAAKFGRHVGFLEGVILAKHWPMVKVAPITWMKKVVPDRPREKEARKKYIKAQMQEGYPDLKVTLATADALGILTYAIT